VAEGGADEDVGRIILARLDPRGYRGRRGQRGLRLPPGESLYFGISACRGWPASDNLLKRNVRGRRTVITASQNADALLISIVSLIFSNVNQFADANLPPMPVQPDRLIRR
jgi:hypothetical protein